MNLIDEKFINQSCFPQKINNYSIIIEYFLLNIFFKNNFLKNTLDSFNNYAGKKIKDPLSFKFSIL